MRVARFYWFWSFFILAGAVSGAGRFRAEDDLATNARRDPVTATVNGIPVEAILIATPEVPVVDDPGHLSVDNLPGTPTHHHYKKRGRSFLSDHSAWRRLGGAPLTAFVVGLAKHIPCAGRGSAHLRFQPGFLWRVLTVRWIIPFRLSGAVHGGQRFRAEGRACAARTTTTMAGPTLPQGCTPRMLPVFGYQEDKAVLACPISEDSRWSRG